MEPKLLTQVPTTLKASEGTRKPVFDDKQKPPRWDFDVFENYLFSKQSLTPGNDYLFYVAGEGGKTILKAQIDKKVAQFAQNLNYPFINCRLLTPAQQDTGDPEKPRSACATGVERTGGMKIPPGDLKPRGVDVVVMNEREVDDPLALAPLKYTLRIYQWVPAGGGRGTLPNPFK